MQRAGLIHIFIIIFIDIVFAGWWISVLVRPGVPMFARKGMTIAMAVVLAVSIIVIIALRNDRK